MSKKWTQMDKIWTRIDNDVQERVKNRRYNCTKVNIIGLKISVKFRMCVSFS